MNTNRHEWNFSGKARHSVRAALDWWGEATDEPAREDARPTSGAHGVTRLTPKKREGQTFVWPFNLRTNQVAR